MTNRTVSVAAEAALEASTALRDASNRLQAGLDRAEQIRNEAFARHEEDLNLIRAQLNRMIGEIERFDPAELRVDRELARCTCMWADAGHSASCPAFRVDRELAA